MMRAKRAIKFLWIALLAIGLLAQAWHILHFGPGQRNSDLPIGSDSFGYLQGAKEFRLARAEFRLPHLWIDAPETRELVTIVRPLAPIREWDELVAPHAHHYAPGRDRVINQYPPGTAWMLSLFPEGMATVWLLRFAVAVILGLAFAGMISAERRGESARAGMIALAATFAIGTLWDGYSVTAVAAPLALAFACLIAGAEEKSAFAGGALLGFATLCRIQCSFCAPGIFAMLKGRRLAAALLGFAIFGVLPLALFQSWQTGHWYVPTYGAGDSARPDFAILGAGFRYYLWDGPGSGGIWAITFMLLGIAGSARRHLPKPIGARPILAAALVFGLPTLYFASHRIREAYYSIPTTEATLGVLLWIAGKLPKPASRLAFALTLIPGLAVLDHTRPFLFFREPDHSHEMELEVSAELPPELRSEHAWIWADRYSGTIWYYFRKAAFKLNFGEKPLREKIFDALEARGDRQFIVLDSDDMRRIRDELAESGRTSAPRGTLFGSEYVEIIRAPR